MLGCGGGGGVDMVVGEMVILEWNDEVKREPKKQLAERGDHSPDSS